MNPPLEMGTSDISPLEVYRSVFRGAGWVGIVSLFGIWIAAYNVFANYLINFIWESPTWKGDSGWGVCKDFARSTAEWMAISLEPKLEIFINSGKTAIVSGVVSAHV